MQCEFEDIAGISTQYLEQQFPTPMEISTCPISQPIISLEVNPILIQNLTLRRFDK